MRPRTERSSFLYAWIADDPLAWVRFLGVRAGAKRRGRTLRPPQGVPAKGADTLDDNLTVRFTPDGDVVVGDPSAYDPPKEITGDPYSLKAPVWRRMNLLTTSSAYKR
ncbi:MAG: hypothetical protein ACLQVD_20320 [Capsulimonadaceae bacterium]